MHSDRVSTTGSESRKSSKPIMEKRRRARINASLAELKSLLLEVIKKEGARHSKMEKADILEMAVKHLRQIQRQQYTGSGSDPTLSDKYRLGFNECAQEVSRYLGASEDDDAELRARLLNHLSNCIASSDSPSPVSTPSSSPAPALLGHGLGTAASPSTSSSSGTVAVTPLTPIPVRPAVKPATPVFSVSPQSATGGVSGGLTPPAAVLVPAEMNNNNASLANNNLVGVIGSDTSAMSHHVTLTSVSPSQALHVPSATKVLGELQVLPPKTGSGEVAFVLPMGGGHIPSYIIPVYTSPPSIPTSVSLAPNAPAPSALPVQLPIMASPQVSAAVAASGAAPSLLALTPSGGVLPPVSIAAGVIPPVSVSHVVATRFDGSLSWPAEYSAPSNPVPSTVASLIFSSHSPSATITSSSNPTEEASSQRSSPFKQTKDGSSASLVPLRVALTQRSPAAETVSSDPVGPAWQSEPRVPAAVIPEQGKDVWRPW